LFQKVKKQEVRGRSVLDFCVDGFLQGRQGGDSIAEFSVVQNPCGAGRTDAKTENIPKGHDISRIDDVNIQTLSVAGSQRAENFGDGKNIFLLLRKRSLLFRAVKAAASPGSVSAAFHNDLQGNGLRRHGTTPPFYHC
jgi:hypothetical protein